MDVLADVFAALRVGGMIYAQNDLHAPWGMAFNRSTKAGFHVVVRGSCWLRTENHVRLELHQGDVVLLPRGWTHSLADSATRRAFPYQEVAARQRDGEAASGRATRILCGAYQLAPEGGRSLLSLLPSVVHLRADDAIPELREVVAGLSREASGNAPGAAAATSRLADLLLIYVLRAWIARLPPGGGGWLGALRDPSIARALSLLHDDVASRWEMAALAKKVGLSRATFARRFGRLVGSPPLAYLARWRMTLAGRLLRETDDALAEIAHNVGYDSEFAFNRAFKRELGVSPGEYRKRHASAGDP